MNMFNRKPKGINRKDPCKASICDQSIAIHVSLPVSVLNKIDALAGTPDNRSAFIEKAINKQIEILEFGGMG